MLIATPNLCLDRTQFLTRIVPGAVMRAAHVEVTAGGKGVNIARVVRAFGGKAVLAGLVGQEDRERLVGLLAEEGADLREVSAPGPVRMAIVMIEQEPGRVTIVNEPGSPVAPEVWQRYADEIDRNLPGQDLLICSGSLPPGAPPDAYGQLVEAAHRAGALALVDTAPAALRAALASGPDLVAPNLQEAESALAGTSGAVLADADEDIPERAADAARALCAEGARAAAVTVGGDGIALARQGSAAVQWIRTVPVDVVSAVGAGDSFLAGVALSLQGQLPGPVDWRSAVLRGAATATASCENLRAGGVDPARVETLLARIEATAGQDRSVTGGGS
ncbi:1-phosphofructokinase family hexose kinase [Streptomyces sp. NPDC058001]|uniref:1-phosphofructokinase family hexose kinase n=1 Tax=Streptomyces sp. NPDC058001 TaxID=3346300 RepID=UPI0036E592CB